MSSVGAKFTTDPETGHHNMQVMHVILSQRDRKAPSGQRVMELWIHEAITEMNDLSKCQSTNMH